MQRSLSVKGTRFWIKKKNYEKHCQKDVERDIQYPKRGVFDQFRVPRVNNIQYVFKIYIQKCSRESLWMSIAGGKLKRFLKIPNKIHNKAQVNLFTKMRLHFDPSSLFRRLRPPCRPTFKSLDDWPVRNSCFAFGQFTTTSKSRNFRNKASDSCEIFNAITTTPSLIFFHVFS